MTFSSSGELNIGNTVFPVCCSDGKEENGISCRLEARSADNDETTRSLENEYLRLVITSPDKLNSENDDVGRLTK